MRIEQIYLKVRRVVEKIRKRLSLFEGKGKTIYVWDRVPFYREMWQTAASGLDLAFVGLADDVWEIRDERGGVLTRINNCYVELDDPVTLYIAGNKSVTYKLLDAAGIPVAVHADFTLDSIDILRRFVADNAGPYVVKPASGTGSGIGVTTHLHSFRECLRAAVLASLYCNELIVEQFFPGEVYRLLFVNSELISAVVRRGVWVVGDGKSTLGELADRTIPEASSGGNRTEDLDMASTISCQGYERVSVIESGQRVLIKSSPLKFETNSEVRTIYTESANDVLNPQIVQSCQRACEVLRSEFCGVDLIIRDPALPLGHGNGIVGEVNTTPGLHHHYDLDNDSTSVHAASAVLQHVLRIARH